MPPTVERMHDLNQEQHHEPRIMEVSEPNRDLLSCMKGEWGFGWYVSAWIAALTLPMLAVAALITVVAAG
jgi:hypothetical protein